MNAPTITQQYSFAQKAQAVERELKFRRRVYPRWVENKQMTAEHAAYQISVFETILEDYREQAKKERLL